MKKSEDLQCISILPFGGGNHFNWKGREDSIDKKNHTRKDPTPKREGGENKESVTIVETWNDQETTKLVGVRENSRPIDPTNFRQEAKLEKN